MGREEDNVCKPAIQIQLKVLYTEVEPCCSLLLALFLHDAKNQDSGETLCLATETPSTASLPSSIKFWYSLMVNDPLSMSIVLFGILLLCFDSEAYKSQNSFTRI